MKRPSVTGGSTKGLNIKEVPVDASASDATAAACAANESDEDALGVQAKWLQGNVDCESPPVASSLDESTVPQRVVQRLRAVQQQPQVSWDDPTAFMRTGVTRIFTSRGRRFRGSGRRKK